MLLQDESNPVLWLATWAGEDGAIFDSVSVHKYGKKELGEYQVLLTEHLVNNPYIIFSLVQNIDNFYLQG